MTLPFFPHGTGGHLFCRGLWFHGLGRTSRVYSGCGRSVGRSCYGPHPRDNATQQETLLLLARVCGNLDAQQASITTMDRLGFHLRVKTPDRMQGGRFAFTDPVHNVQEARAALADLANKAKAGAQVLHSL